MMNLSALKQRQKDYINDDEIPYNSNGRTNGDFICLGEIIGNNELGLKKDNIFHLLLKMLVVAQDVEE